LNIVNVGYDSTNYYVLQQGATRLLIDVGFPGTLPRLEANLKRKDIALKSIGYLLATHYHPDHAGITQELKQRGVRLIVVDVQRDAIPALATMVKPDPPYLPIRLTDNIDITIAGSRAFLAGLGIGGEILHTPGHSGDSVSLVLDNGAAFTGDLTPPGFSGDTVGEIIAASWEALRQHGARMLYPGHGPARPAMWAY
jgi:glyoxylase-like metal-dependent hydrolase (beta-lactamase superfamily II)